MAYVRSVREISVNDEPLASALAAIAPDLEESPPSSALRWENATEEQIRLLQMHPGTASLFSDGVGPAGEVL